jgi:hypothetical protein
MRGKRAAIIVSDPPYNVRIDGNVCGNGSIQHREFQMASGEMSEAEFIRFLSTSLRLFAKYSVSGSIHYLFMDWRHMRELLAAGGEAYDSLLNLYSPGEQSVNCAVYAVRSRSLVRFHKRISQQLAEIRDFLCF